MKTRARNSQSEDSMEHRESVFFPVSIPAHRLRHLVPSANELPDDAALQLCADGTVLVPLPGDRVDVATVRLTPAQIAAVIAAL